MSLPIWQEVLVGIEMIYLRFSPVYWGAGIPEGDGSGVVVIPPLLASDLFLAEFRGWLSRIGYRPYPSGIGSNADCPNLLIREHLGKTVEKAWKETGRRKIHLIGHSLGGLIGRAVAAQTPERIASIVTMASPIHQLRVHPILERLIGMVRSSILARHRLAVAGDGAVLPTCYTPACTCDFLKSVMLQVPPSVYQTAIYSKADGFVDWRTCRTGDPAVDVEVSATHVGMAFSPIVYRVVAQRLAEARVSAEEVGRAAPNRRSGRRRRAA